MFAATLTVFGLTACAPRSEAAEPGFVKVLAGTFDMGSTPGQPDLGYGVHAVTLTHDYFVAVTEVTQAEFQATMGYNSSEATECGGQSLDACPAETLTWHEAAAYANVTSDAASLPRCYTCSGSGLDIECEIDANPYECEGYRLPTEAEWEAAARCGSDSAWAGSDTSTDVAWTQENSEPGPYSSPHPVGGLSPNPCGIYDLSGNVWEWTQDWKHPYPSDEVTDPGANDVIGDERVRRGGSYAEDDSAAVVSHRSSEPPTYADHNLGCRLVRSNP